MVSGPWVSFLGKYWESKKIIFLIFSAKIESLLELPANLTLGGKEIVCISKTREEKKVVHLYGDYFRARSLQFEDILNY